RRHHPQVEVAEQYCFFAAVCDWPESARRPRLEVCDSHLAAQNEHGKARKQAQRKENRTDRLKQTGNASLRKQVGNSTGSRKAKKFLCAVLKKQQRGGNAHGEDQRWRVTLRLSRCVNQRPDPGGNPS